MLPFTGQEPEKLLFAAEGGSESPHSSTTWIPLFDLPRRRRATICLSQEAAPAPARCCSPLAWPHPHSPPASTPPLLPHAAFMVRSPSPPGSSPIRPFYLAPPLSPLLPPSTPTSFIRNPIPRSRLSSRLAALKLPKMVPFFLYSQFFLKKKDLFAFFCLMVRCCPGKRSHKQCARQYIFEDWSAITSKGQPSDWNIEECHLWVFRHQLLLQVHQIWWPLSHCFRAAGIYVFHYIVSFGSIMFKFFQLPSPCPKCLPSSSVVLISGWSVA